MVDVADQLSLAIDASAARIGGGASRVRELQESLASLAPGLPTLLIAGPVVARTLPMPSGALRHWVVPRPLSHVVTRVPWEHAWLPRFLARERPRWLLSPFNVLPLGPGLPSSTRTAVVISNIGPLTGARGVTLTTYQRARNALLRRLTRATVERADHVFLLSNEAKELLADVLDPAKTTRLPMAPPPPSVLSRAAQGLATDESMVPFALVVGDLSPHKGVEDAIHAILEIRATGRPFTLVVCGTATDQAYARRLRSLAARAKGGVRFTGPVPHVRALALMRTSVATVLCSRIENTSRVPVEAMAMGSPLVLADIPNLRSEAGDAAIYYPPGDAPALAEAIESLVYSETRQRYVALGRDHLSGVDWLSATRTMLETLQLL